MNKRKAAGRIFSSVSSSWKVLRFVAPQPSAVPVGGLHAVPVRSHDHDNDISARLQRHESRRLPKRRGLQCYFGFPAPVRFHAAVPGAPAQDPRWKPPLRRSFLSLPASGEAHSTRPRILPRASSDSSPPAGVLLQFSALPTVVPAACPEWP